MATTRLLSTETVRQRIAEMENGEYSLIGEYTDAKSPIQLLHIPCGNTITVRAKGFMQEGNGRCKICNPVTAKRGKVMDATEFARRFLTYPDLVAEYEIAGQFEAYKKPVALKHITCGNTWNVTPHMLFNLNKQRRCPHCANLSRGSHLRDENYLQNILESVEWKDEYQWVNPENYDYDNKQKYEMLHKTCGRTYMVRPNDFQQGYRCPHCSQEKNESYTCQEITDILTRLELPFEKETKYPGLFYKAALRFDFDIDLGNDEHLIIEYDGLQHTNAIRKINGEINGASSTFLRKAPEIVARDKAKDEFCQKNPNFHLYRIKHTDDHKVVLQQILAAYFEGVPETL